MSYFPCDIPFMSEDEKKKNGIKCNSDVDKEINVPSNDTISRQMAINAFDCTDELIVSGSANAQNVVDYINKVVGKIKALPPVQPDEIAIRLAYMRGQIDGIKECTEKLRKLNEEFE